MTYQRFVRIFRMWGFEVHKSFFVVHESSWTFYSIKHSWFRTNVFLLTEKELLAKLRARSSLWNDLWQVSPVPFLSFPFPTRRPTCQLPAGTVYKHYEVENITLFTHYLEYPSVENPFFFFGLKQKVDLKKFGSWNSSSLWIIHLTYTKNILIIITQFDVYMYI